LVPLEDPMALVHWWYWPSSYDEWMLACDVAGEGESHPPARPKGGPWVVGCKFIRDVENFNEWGLEADYAIVEYSRKVTFYAELEEKKKAKAQLAKKEARKSMTDGSKQHGTKHGESNTKDGASLQMHPTSTSQANAGLGKAPAKGKPGRQSGEGINPRRILTGFYSESGSRMRRTVYDGALRIPSDASTLMHHAINRVYQKNSDKIQNSNTADPTATTTHTNAANNSTNNNKNNSLLPPINSVLRPSEDPNLASNFIVTELRAGASGLTIASNRRIICTPSPPVVAFAAVEMQGGPHRIRGGGEVNEALASDVGQFDDAGEGNKGDGGNVAHLPNYANQAAITVDKDAVQEEILEEGKVPSTDSIINVGEGGVTVAADSTVGGENKLSFLEKIIDQQKSIESGTVAEGTEMHVEQTTTISNISKAVDSANNLASNNDVTMQVDSVPITSSTQSARLHPIHVPSGSTVVKGNPILSKLAESSGTSSMLNTVPSLTDAVLPPAAIAEKKPLALPGTSSTSKQDDDPAAKKKCPLPILAPLREKFNTASSHKTASHITNDDKAKNGTSLTGDQEPTISSPRWYNSKRVSDFERNMLPEWFNQSAIHRTPSTYLSTREQIIDVARESGTKYATSTAKKYLTSTAIRRCVPGDAGSLLRLHQFLVTWGFINGSAIGDLAPTGLNLTKGTSHKTSSTILEGHIGRGDAFVRSGFWSEARNKLLTNSVVLLSSRKRKLDDQRGNQTTVDWEAVADKVGDGVTPIECQRRFLSLNFSEVDYSKLSEVCQDDSDDKTTCGIDSKPNLTGNKTEARKENIFYELIDGTCPEVVQAATDAALQMVDGDIAQAQKASLLSIISVNGLARAEEEEAATEKILQEILDQRMAKLENRLALLEDAEGILDAERISLELERRDLYTARCRHWFAGGT